MTTSQVLAAPAPPPTLAGLRSALSAGQVVVRYQPVVQLADGAPVAVEVLARLARPGGGLIEPADFVPRMEAAGLAWRLTQAVFRCAFAEWREFGLGGLGMALAVNVPLDAMLRRGAASWIERERRAAGLPAALLILELTESRPVNDIPALREAVARLRAYGYRLAIDDVGPAGRAPENLLDMPFSIMKLDQNLVAEVGRSEPARAFLIRAVAAARIAGMRIVAEGIEDQPTWQRMQSLGVDEGQGFAIARPLTAEALRGWRQRWLGPRAAH
ncbi:MAG: EAL domain-containing protein [Rhodospirillales bacterium]|nr:EAL domain-containing protein [Rhodospirillales bacterium]